MAAYDKECLDQVARTMEILKGKWTFQILCALLAGPVN
jgi:DNA-binding HxlR family transcriptional regulator